jgi:TRAP-type C4-dicarboxylate transport system permease small subunit
LVRVASRIRSVAEAISAALLAATFAVALAGVFMRYVAERPISWADELGMIMLIWGTFVADAFVTRDSDQVAFDIAWDAASPGGRRTILILQGALFAGLFACALPFVVDYVLFLWRERTSSLEWRLDFVFACFPVYLAAWTVRLAFKCCDAIFGDWEAQVRDSDPASQSDNLLG